MEFRDKIDPKERNGFLGRACRTGSIFHDIVGDWLLAVFGLNDSLTLVLDAFNYIIESSQNCNSIQSASEVQSVKNGYKVLKMAIFVLGKNIRFQTQYLRVKVLSQPAS